MLFSLRAQRMGGSAGGASLFWRPQPGTVGGGRAEGVHLREQVPPERPGSGSQKCQDSGFPQGGGTAGLGGQIRAQGGVFKEIWEELSMMDNG